MTERQSLILSQPDLPMEIPVDALAALEGAEAKGEYTGARLFERDPNRYRLIVSLLAEGVGILRIAECCHVGAHTVIAVRDREPTAVAMEKERIASMARAASRMSVEAIVDDLNGERTRAKISTRDKAIVAGVLLDKAESLNASSGHIPEFHLPEPGHDDFNDYLANMSAIDAGTGLKGDAPEQKGLPAGLGDAAGAGKEADPDAQGEAKQAAPQPGAEIEAAAGGPTAGDGETLPRIEGEGKNP